MEAQATSDVVKTTSPQKTQKIAQKLAKSLKGGNVIALFGDLGAGKTTFVQGLAKGLGIRKRILSPTFVLLRSYPIKNHSLLFHHLDLYRIESNKDLKTLDLPQIFSKNSIVAIEWAEKIKELLPAKRIDVFIDRTGENTRRIKITPTPIILSPSLSFPPSHLSFPRPPKAGPPLAEKRESRSWIPDQVRNDNKVSSRLHSNINKAAQVLKNGGVVIFPTDTVYGIGCRLDNQKAINRIYQIKGSPKNQPFPILVSSVKQVEALAQIPDNAKKLIKKYWPGGLTIVLAQRTSPTSPHLSTYFKPGLKQLDKPGLKSAKLGFRMPDSKLLINIINNVGPIIGTSANFHGVPTPKRYQELDPNFVKLVDFVIKDECKIGIESTVVDATKEPFTIIRQGAVSL